MASIISQAMASGRQQMSLAPPSPLRRNPIQNSDVPEVPPIPPRLNGYQRDRGLARLGEPYEQRNGSLADTIGKPESSSPRAMQIPSRRRSVLQVAELTVSLMVT